MNFDAINKRIEKAQEHLGQTVTYNSVVYGCLPSGMRDSDLRNRDNTFRNNYRTSIFILKDDFEPSKGDVVKYLNTTLRVLSTSETGDGEQIRLDLGQQY